jgi:hypothetical protein
MPIEGYVDRSHRTPNLDLNRAESRLVSMVGIRSARRGARIRTATVLALAAMALLVVATTATTTKATAAAATTRHIDTTTFVTEQPASAQQLAADVATIKKRLSDLCYGSADVEVTRNGITVRRSAGNIAPSVLQSATMVGDVYWRPVLCLASPLANMPTDTPATLPACAPPYTGSAAHVSAGVGPDPQFSSYVDTPAGIPGYRNQTVLLSGLPVGTGGSGSTGPSKLSRFVLGPTEMTGRSIGSAIAQRDPVGLWVVDFKTTSTEWKTWDRTADRSFHERLAIELDGVVQTAPIIEPAQKSFTSFQGLGEISGTFTRTQARTLALALDTKPLAVPLEVP